MIRLPLPAVNSLNSGVSFVIVVCASAPELVNSRQLLQSEWGNQPLRIAAILYFWRFLRCDDMTGMWHKTKTFQRTAICICNLHVGIVSTRTYFQESLHLSFFPYSYSENIATHI
jgi:hypothetical protein